MGKGDLPGIPRGGADARADSVSAEGVGKFINSAI